MSVIISFEGIDGVGKSTVIEQVKTKLQEKDKTVLMLQEPGTTEFGKEIRNLIKTEIPRAELSDVLLFLAARADMVEKVMIQALKIYDYILIDRYIDSTIAYQGYGNGVDTQLLSYLNRNVINNLMPHKTILLTVDEQEAAHRRKSRGDQVDRYEDPKFLKKVADGYDILAKQNPDRIITIENNDLDTTVKEALKAIENREKKAHTREKLAKNVEERLTYRAIIGRPGRDELDKPTLLLKTVKRKGGKIVTTDHAWVPYTRELLKAGTLLPGDLIEFVADVETYEHTARNGTTYLEYGLANITDVRLVKGVPIPPCEEKFERNDLTNITSVVVDELYEELASRYIRFISAMSHKYFNHD